MSVYPKIDNLKEIIEKKKRSEVLSELEDFYSYSVEIFKEFDRVVENSLLIKNNNSIVPERNPILKKIIDIKTLFKDKNPDLKEARELFIFYTNNIYIHH